jgi:glycosyltransferase involved in cell wall biosynthesis
VTEGRKTKVVLVLEATQGGTRRHLLDLVYGLPPERFEMIPVVSLRGDGEFLPDLKKMWTEGRRVKVLPMKRRPAPLSDLISLWRLWRFLRKEKPDVLHAHGSKGGLLGRLAGRLAGVPLVFHTPHVYPFQWARWGVTRLIFQLVERLLWRLSSKVIAVGKGQAEVALSHRLATAERLRVIPNGVNAPTSSTDEKSADRERIRAELNLTPETQVVGMIGRLAPQKGCSNFLRAALLVLKSFPDTRFLLVGAGPKLPELHQLAEELGIAGNVSFLGHRGDIPALLPALDVFVLSSLWEGLPYAILEAQAAGLPVVASRIPGCRELIQEGETGFLVEINNQQEISERICRLLDSETLRTEIGNRGREVVSQSFRLSDFIEKHISLYEGKL